MGSLLRKEFDWSQDVAAIRAPTMLVLGDSDSVVLKHIVEFFELLGGERRMGAGMGQEFPTRGWPFCRA